MLLEYQCISVAPHTVLIDIFPARLHVLPYNSAHIFYFLQQNLVSFEKKSKEWVEIEILIRNKIKKKEALGVQENQHAEMASS